MTALTIGPRVAQLAAEAVDPARSALWRDLATGDVRARLAMDNPTARGNDIDQAVAAALEVARP